MFDTYDMTYDDTTRMGQFSEVVHTLLHHADEITTNRKGEKLWERRNETLVFPSMMSTFLWQRKPSMSYLSKELQWYADGSLSVEDATRCASFWSKCSDDGCTVNSNYGHLLFHSINKRGYTQFGHAFNCLLKSPWSKKAVMVLYDKEHAYHSNDNPCTMFCHFFATRSQSGRVQLNMNVHMRSNDVWFGTTYDAPFFYTVLRTMVAMLNTFGFEEIDMGTYYHTACNLHFYERDIHKWNELCSTNYIVTQDQINEFKDVMRKGRDLFYSLALKAVAEQSKHM